MFCTHCGAEIPDGSKFCTKCGQGIGATTLSEAATQAPDVQTEASEQTPDTLAEPQAGAGKSGKKGIPVKVVIPIVAAAVVAAGAFVLVKNQRTTVNLSDYVEVTVSGYDGYGTASYTLAREAFDDAYQDKLHTTASALEKAVDGDDTEESVLEKYIRIYGGYEDCAASVNNSGAGDLLFYCYEQELTPVEGLSNGDTVTLSWDISEEEQSQIENALHCKIVAEDVTITVEDLEEAALYDPFDGLTLTFTGVEPEGSAQLASRGKEDACKDLHYSIDPSSSLSNGDTVTVTAGYSGSTDWVVESAEKYGKVPSVTTKEFVVEGLDYYVESVEEIPEETLALMKEQAEEMLLSSNDIHSSESESQEITGYEYIGSYLLSAKNTYVNYTNKIYLIYKFRTHMTASYQSDKFDESRDAYWACEFNNILVTSDDQCKVDLKNSRTKYGGFYVNSDVNAGWFSTYKFYIAGYEDMASLHEGLVEDQKDNYSCEEKVEDVELAITEAAAPEEKELTEINPYEADLLNDSSEQYTDYTSAIRFRAGNGNSLAYAKYWLGGQYDTLTFTLIPQQDSFGQTAQMYFVNAETGEVLECIEMQKKDIPKEYTVDVSGVNALEICDVKSGLLSYIIMADATVTAASGESLPLAYSDANFADVPESEDHGDNVALAFLKPYASDYYSTPDPVVVWAEDNFYVWANTISLTPAYGSESKVVYDLDGQYDMLEFELSPATNGDFSDKSVVAYEMINEESGEVLYTLNVTKSTEITKATVDVTGVNYLTLHATYTSKTNENRILLHDAYLSLADK